MNKLFKIVVFRIHAWLNKILVKWVDVNDSNDVIKIVTKNIGISWIEMINHVEVTNKFFIPYKLIEVKLTYYNDANQNVGYLHFHEPVKIGAYSKKVVEMPAKMSNITAIFNMVRLMITNDIKTRTVGTSTIQILGIKFVLPIDDIMVIDKDKIVMEEEEDKQKRLEKRAKREKEQAIKKVEQIEKRKMRLFELNEQNAKRKAEIKEKIKARQEKFEQKREAMARLKRMKEVKKEQAKLPKEKPVEVKLNEKG